VAGCRLLRSRLQPDDAVGGPRHHVGRARLPNGPLELLRQHPGHAAQVGIEAMERWLRPTARRPEWLPRPALAVSVEAIVSRTGPPRISPTSVSRSRS